MRENQIKLLAITVAFAAILGAGSMYTAKLRLAGPISVAATEQVEMVPAARLAVLETVLAQAHEELEQERDNTARVRAELDLTKARREVSAAQLAKAANDRQRLETELRAANAGRQALEVINQNITAANNRQEIELTSRDARIEALQQRLAQSGNRASGLMAMVAERDLAATRARTDAMLAQQVTEALQARLGQVP